MTDLAFDSIELMERSRKPRARGITYVRDRGLGIKSIVDAFEASADYIDVMKLAAFAPRLQTRKLIAEKVAVCRDFNVGIGLGGPLLENALLQGRDTVRRFLDQVQELGIQYLEVCRQVIILPLSDLCELVQEVNERGIHPIAEVGVAYGITAEEKINLDLDRLLTTMKACLEAGAWKVLLESEGITESRHPSEYRYDIASRIASAIDINSVMFEADDPDVYTRYICDHGPEVNLFVDIARALALEGARLGGWGKHPIMARTATFTRGR
jgi:phosphosulfolactate synthase (CoM biosynthesis protein A)